MAQIALNKPSGGQLLIAPEDGTSTETVTIPSVGVGKVLQVVQATSTTSTSTAATNTWTGVAGTASITPTSTTSKILVMHKAGALLKYAGSVGFRIVRDGSTVILQSERNEGYTDLSSNWTAGDFDIMYLDSPSSISELTYSFAMKQSLAGEIRHNNGTADPSYAVTILMEVAA